MSEAPRIEVVLHREFPEPVECPQYSGSLPIFVMSCKITWRSEDDWAGYRFTVKVFGARRKKDGTPYAENSDPEEPMDPAEKVRIVEAMGFIRHGGEHNSDCPATFTRGLRCICVPGPDFYTVPKDVAALWGQTWEGRLAAKRMKAGDPS